MLTLYLSFHDILTLLRARQWRDGSCAGFLHAEFLTSEVGHLFCHQSVSHHLSTRDGDKAFQAIPRLMVEDDNATADAAARGIVVGSDEGTDTGVGADDACRGEARSQMHTFTDQQVYLFGRGIHVVHLVEGNAVTRRTDDADGIVGDEDIAIGRFAATVDDHVIHTVAEDQQRALGGEHVDLHAGELGNGLPPDASGIDDEAAVNFMLLTIMVIAQTYALDAAILGDEADHFLVGEDLGPMALGINDVGRGKAERIYGRIRNTDGTDEVGIDSWLNMTGFVGRENLRTDARFPAGFHKGLLIVETVFGECDEEAVGGVYAMAGDMAQDLILTDTLACAFLIGDSIARTTMEKTVVTAGSSIGEVPFLYEQHF